MAADAARGQGVNALLVEMLIPASQELDAMDDHEACE
jgi:hypothetical protein